MKKLLLATGIFLGLGFGASAQEKKVAVKPVTAIEAAHPASGQLRKKKTLSVANRQRIAEKNAIENAKATNTAAPKAKKTGADRSKETINTPAN
ncbi:MAG: hypothetical protein H7258_09285 [Ferruginibacter sp.]|nr:hypothetical protein [Ferruginibacter sp.]